MRTLVESFKRLYDRHAISKEQLQARLSKGLITEDEYEYITGESIAGE